MTNIKSSGEFCCGPPNSARIHLDKPDHLRPLKVSSTTSLRNWQTNVWTSSCPTTSLRWKRWCLSSGLPGLPQRSPQTTHHVHHLKVMWWSSSEKALTGVFDAGTPRCTDPTRILVESSRDVEGRHQNPCDLGVVGQNQTTQIYDNWTVPRCICSCFEDVFYQWVANNVQANDDFPASIHQMANP